MFENFFKNDDSWKCEYCGESFATESKAVTHEKKCSKKQHVKQFPKYSWGQFGLDMLLAVGAIIVTFLLMSKDFQLGAIAALVFFVLMLNMEKPSMAGFIYSLLHFNIIFLIWWAIIKRERKNE
ncbi:MAG: hypothetical protein PHU51_05120 [Candidatus Nanoarchaeia archaeon]|nr:hypothetical protein [Candidatus Nanoarchaeia archaeon]